MNVGPDEQGAGTPPPPEPGRGSRVIESLHRRPLVDLVIGVVERDRAAAGSVVGSAIAFRLFLFFVPLLLFLVGLLGFLGTWFDRRDVETQAGVTGVLADQIDTALTQPTTTRWLAVGTGLIGMVMAGRSLSRVLVTASCLAWRLPVSSKAPVRVVGGIVGLVVGALLIAVLVNRVRAELGVAVTSASLLAAFALYVIGWLLLGALLPRGSADLGALLPGAVVMGAALAGMQAVSQLYLPERIGRASALYGTIGTAIVILGWFFILGRVLVLSLVVDATIHERFGSVARFVFALPILRAVARRSARIRRLFALDEP